MKTQEVINIASVYLENLPGNQFDILTIAEPQSIETAICTSKIISKLSPLVGNLIEFNIVDFLNSCEDLNLFGTWKRQDPGFPDTIFDGDVLPTPGFEIKAWFPLATEITARFKDSQDHFLEDQTYVALIAWLPEYVIYGAPKIIDILITSGASVANARDEHYHNPPHYIVVEPENTIARTRNLQQTNTNGFKLQDEDSDVAEAEALVASWGENGKKYSTSVNYQQRIKTLIRNFNYRSDTNYAKMDRIEHPEILSFKNRVLNTEYHGLTIRQWNKLFTEGSDEAIANAFRENLGLG